MKILNIITGLGMGGAENVVCNLSDALYLNGYEVKIVYLYGDAIVKPSSRVSVEKVNILNPIKAIFKLINIIKTYRPDIVHGHMFHANIVTRVLKIVFPSLRVINTAHSGNEGGALRMFLYRISNALIDTFTNVSVGAVREFEEKKAVKKNSMIAMPNGIDLTKFSHDDDVRKIIREKLSVKEDEKLILSVGSLRDAKNFELAIKAAKYMKDFGQLTFKWVIIGDGPMKSSLEKQINNLGLTNAVKMIGSREDVYKFYSAADLFVSTSKWEGFGLVIAEAISSRLLVVSTNTSGASQIISCTDALVEGNNEILLSEKIFEFLSMPLDKSNCIKKSNFEYVASKFSMDAYVGEWNKIYRK